MVVARSDTTEICQKCGVNGNSSGFFPSFRSLLRQQIDSANRQSHSNNDSNREKKPFKITTTKWWRCHSNTLSFIERDFFSVLVAFVREEVDVGMKMFWLILLAMRTHFSKNSFNFFCAERILAKEAAACNACYVLSVTRSLRVTCNMGKWRDTERGSKESAFVASWVHKARHGNVNNAAPNDNPRREPKRRATHTAFDPKYSVSFKTHGHSLFHGESASHTWHILCVSLLCTLAHFFYSFHPRCCTSVYNCSEYALWFWELSHTTAVCVACTERTETVAILSLSFSASGFWCFGCRALKINNIVQLRMNVQ